jgi:uncharacterized protein (TIGR03086 family)
MPASQTARPIVAAMSDNLRIYTKAIYGFDHVARLAGDGDWNKPSPCEGWNARHVIGHVLAIQRYIESLIRDVPPSMNPMVDPDRNCGAHPYETWAAARDGVLEALDHPDVLGRTVQNWNGPATVDAVIGFNVADTTIHSWDLARALGVDDRLDPATVAHAMSAMAPVLDGLRGVGFFGQAIEVGSDADPQARLLGVAGRRI